MTYVVAEWQDFYRHQSASAVLVGDQVLVLSELATALVILVGEGIEFEPLAAAILARFGPPATDPTEAIKAALHELVQAGVLKELR